MFIPLITKLELNQALTLVGLMILKFSSDVLQGFSSEGWMYYLGKNCKELQHNLYIFSKHVLYFSFFD